MGKRGPLPGTKYRRRVPERVRIETEAELTAAQGFCERLDLLLKDMEEGLYPAAALERKMANTLRQTVETIQSTITEGIAAYYANQAYYANHGVPRRPATPSESGNTVAQD